MNENIFVSVIIPVFNDPERLETCLKALEQQTYPKLCYEVIVVDNGSKESPEIIVNKFPQASLTTESKPGSYAARNQGISLAKGEIIAFTDSDCIPAANWIETGVKNLLSVPNCGLVAGKIEMFFKNPNRPTAVEVYDSVTFLQQEDNIKYQKYGTTANLFTFKSVLESVGNFNAQVKSGGDSEWGKRVFARGYVQLYAEDCCVGHPARYSFSQIYKKITRVKGGTYDLENLKDNKESKKFSSNLSIFKPPILSSLRLILFDERVHNDVKTQVFFLKILVHYIIFWEEKRLQQGRSSKRE